MLLSETMKNRRYQLISETLKNGELPIGFSIESNDKKQDDIKNPSNKAKILNEKGELVATYYDFAQAWVLAENIDGKYFSSIAGREIISQQLFKEKEEAYIRETTIVCAIDEYGFKGKDFDAIKQALEEGKLPDGFSIKEERVNPTDSKSPYTAELYYKDVLFAKLEPDKTEWEIVAMSRVDKVPPVTSEELWKIDIAKTTTAPKVKAQRDSFKTLDEIILEAEQKINERTYTISQYPETTVKGSEVKHMSNLLKQGYIPGGCVYERFHYDGEFDKYYHKMPGNLVDCDSIYYNGAQILQVSQQMQWEITIAPKSIDDRVLTSKEIPYVDNKATHTPNIILDFREIVDKEEKDEIDIKYVSIGSKRLTLEEFEKLKESLQERPVPLSVSLVKDGEVISGARLAMLVSLQGMKVFEPGDRLCYDGHAIAEFNHSGFSSWDLIPGVIDKNTTTLTPDRLPKILGLDTTAKHYVKEICRIVEEQSELNRGAKTTEAPNKDNQEEVL